MTKVIIVDDDREIRATLRMVLEEDGLTIVEAADGAKALQEMRASSEPAVVLLDLMMPGMDGVGVLEAVAKEPALRARYRFILMTAAHTTFSLNFVRLLQDLATPVLHKPLDIDVLSRIVAGATRTLPSA